MTDTSDNTVAITITVPQETAPIRIDRFLASSPEIDITRTRIQKLIVEGLITVNGKTISKKYEVKSDDVISVTIPPLEPRAIVSEDIPLSIVYEDDYLLVVDKPAGMVTHPGAGNYRGTLVNALMHHVQTLANKAGEDRPGIVHRLDKNTSGLLVVARSDEVYLKLQQQLQTREMKRTYYALICGHVKEETGTIDAPIGRSLHNRKKMVVTNINSREARTDYQLLERYRSYDFIKASLQTGRTHQIRVHFAHLGHPVFGDPEYGGREKWFRGMFAPERPLAKKLLAILPRQALHAYRLSFTHPITGETKTFKSPLPEDFATVMSMLKSEGQ